MFKKIIINVGLRCCGVGVGCIGAILLLPVIMVHDDNTFRVKLFASLSWAGSLSLISCGVLALCRKPNYLLMSRLVIAGGISHALAFTTLK